MKQQKGLSELAIANKIRQGIAFHIGTKREQKLAYSAAKFAGVLVAIRADPEGWKVHFLHG